MSQEILEQIEREREYHKINLNRGEALKRLLQNDDFKQVFKNYYLDAYLKRLVKDDLASAVADQTKQAAIDRIKAIGLFDQFIKQVDNEANYAKQWLNASEEELITLYREGN